MGKIRHKQIGLEEVEEKDKKKAEARRMAKKSKKTEKKDKQDKKVEDGVKEEKVDNSEKESKKAKGEKSKSKKKIAQGKRVKKGRSHERGRKYKSVVVKRDEKKEYSISDGVKMVRAMKYAKFDETFEIHINVREQGIKGEVAFSHGTGKSVRVKIIDDKVLAEIDSGKFEFDVLIAHPSMMPKLVKYAKVLGPKGLMPNPKNGTLTDKPEEAVKKFSSGVVRFKTEPKAPVIHQGLGKMSFTDKELEENIEAFIKAVGVQNIVSSYIKSTMSPSVRIKVE